MKYFLLFPILLFTMCRRAEKKEAGAAVQIRKSDTSAVNRGMIDKAKGMLRTGDLVFRTGNDLTSFFFKQLNVKDNTYSHCGIASVEDSGVFIYHVLGGEFNPGEQILHEPLNVFISPRENDGFGIFRYPLSASEGNRVIYTARQIQKAGVRFDMDFDLATNHKMYCAEFVHKTLRWATGERIVTDSTNAGFKTGITTDNLFGNAQCRELGRFVYR